MTDLEIALALGISLSGTNPRVSAAFANGPETPTSYKAESVIQMIIIIVQNMLKHAAYLTGQATYTFACTANRHHDSCASTDENEHSASRNTQWS